MNAKMSVFVILVNTIIYLLLYNVHDCNFPYNKMLLQKTNANKINEKN